MRLSSMLEGVRVEVMYVPEVLVSLRVIMLGGGAGVVTPLNTDDIFQSNSFKLANFFDTKLKSTSIDCLVCNQDYGFSEGKFASAAFA